MRELEPGLWYWEATHPDWEPSVSWHHTIVTSYAIDDGEHLLLFDPLAVPNELEELAAERDPVIVLTNPWHERDAAAWSSGTALRCSCPRPATAVPTWPG